MFLLIAIAYLIVATIVVVKVKGWPKKTMWGLIFLLVPTWDYLLAQSYMYYRCKTDDKVGVRVYETVKLKQSDLVRGKCVKSGRSWANVSPQSYAYGADCLFLPVRFEEVRHREETRFGVFHGYIIYRDTTTGKVLGEGSGYDHSWSWALGWTQGSHGSCPGRKPGEEPGATQLRKGIFQLEGQR